MKDNKLYKVLRIIFLTLAIISLVFTLCKKVGLCASVNPPSYTTDFPLPYGPGSNIGYGTFPLTDEIIQGCVSAAFDSSVGSMFSNGYSVTVYEIESNNAYITLSINGGDSIVAARSSFPDLVSGCGVAFDRNGVAEVRYTVSSGSYSVRYTGSSSSQKWCDFGNHLDSLPTGGNALETGTFISGYPVAFSEGYNRSYNNILVFANADSGINFENGEVTSLPSFDSLPGNVTSTDDQQTLFDKLKGWLSTLSGNIQKGFKNIEENLTSFFKPYLDNIKGFFEWVTEPFDPEAASDSLDSIQVISDIRSLNNVIGSSGIFDWDNVTPSSRVAFTFDFGGAVLPHHQYEINFDWYTGTVKTLILSILVTFLVVGLLVTIINNIPSMIHGHSGDSGGGSN